jgi:hypothetical protein
MLATGTGTFVQCRFRRLAAPRSASSPAPAAAAEAQATAAAAACRPPKPTPVWGAIDGVRSRRRCPHHQYHLHLHLHLHHLHLHLHLHQRLHCGWRRAHTLPHTMGTSGRRRRRRGTAADVIGVGHEGGVVVAVHGTGSCRHRPGPALYFGRQQLAPPAAAPTAAAVVGSVAAGPSATEGVRN